MKYYDPQNKRLIYIQEPTTPDYWDRHWENNIKKRLKISRKITLATRINRCYLDFYTRFTKKFLKPEHGPILEGGCGLGKKVEVLCFCGFQCIGVDYARETVKIINENIPELDIRIGDIRKLDFPKSYFAGYWSIGVIEHFWLGYDDIADEMHRVIKPGGYLFLSFPYMSWWRKIKGKRGGYPEFKSQNREKFRQFALNHKDVIKDFENKDFTPVTKKSRAVVFGLKDEFPFLAPVIEGVLKCKDRNLITKTFYLVLDSLSSFLCGWIFGHTIPLVLRKK